MKERIRFIQDIKKRFHQAGRRRRGRCSAPLGHTAAASAAATGAERRVPPYRVGKWLPSDQAVLDRWLAAHIQEVEANPKPLHPSSRSSRISSKPIRRSTCTSTRCSRSFRDAQFQTHPIGTPQVRDYKHMLELINGILTTAPTFNKTGLVGFPINAILDWPMGTPGGFAAFLNDKVNAQFKKILNAWATFLSSPDLATC